MIVSFLLFLLVCVVGIGLFFVIFVIVPYFLKNRNLGKFSFLNAEAKVFSKDEKDIVYLKDVIATSSEMRAVVLCNPKRNVKKRAFEFSGIKDCNIFKNTYNSDSECERGCLGFGSCTQYCPQDAIQIEKGTAVISDSCNGCGICLNVCPNDLIRLIPRNVKYYLPCACDFDENITQVCSTSCSSCGKCLADTTMISKNGSVAIDYSNGILSGEKAKSICPNKCIVETEQKQSNSFKFWELCYNIVSDNSKKED